MFLAMKAWFERLHICHMHSLAEHDQSATSAAGTVLTLQLWVVIILTQQSLRRPIMYQNELCTEAVMTTLSRSNFASCCCVSLRNYCRNARHPTVNMALGAIELVAA